VQYARLGRTGTFVSRICLGTANFGGRDQPTYEVLGGLDAGGAEQLVHAALDAGVNFIDTADSYAVGDAEELVGKLIEGHRPELVLASKVHNRVGPGPNEVGQSRVHILHALEANLRRLRTDYLDLYHVHSFDPMTTFEEVLTTLNDVVRQGKVRYLGCSNLAAWQIMKALGISARHGLEPFVVVQAYYSLAGRDLEDELLPLVLDQGLGLTVWSPLAGGFLSGKFTRGGAVEHDARRATLDFPPLDVEQTYAIVDVLRAIADAHDVTAAQVALAWLLARPGVTSVIVGARRLDQLAANLTSVDLELTAEETSGLDEVSAGRARYPGWLQAYTNAERWPQP